MSLSVGVVVPNFRGGRFLRECLDSLLAQDYPELQIVVMDGGSDDDS
ncbi:MAG: glycosyltransferase, partial [Polyangiaceae bacterium]|nr:glycosyltransferase [Polyangiaceae bacterium]